MRVSMILATDQRYTLGVDGGLPWNLPEERRLFRETTTGDGRNAVLMGRCTMESLRGPLPGRINMALTRPVRTGLGGIAVCGDLAAALEFLRRDAVEETFVIGGAELYASAIDCVSRIYHTSVDACTAPPACSRVVTFRLWDYIDWRDWRPVVLGAWDGVRRERSRTNPHAWVPNAWERRR